VSEGEPVEVTRVVVAVTVTVPEPLAASLAEEALALAEASSDVKMPIAPVEDAPANALETLEAADEIPSVRVISGGYREH
jgi:hypothetical protein